MSEAVIASVTIGRRGLPTIEGSFGRLEDLNP